MAHDLYFNEAFQAVICGTCKSGVVVDTVNSINNHFRPAPHHLKGRSLQAVRDQIQHWAVQRASAVPHPPSKDQPVPAVPHLQTHSGWRCTHCEAWLSADLVNSKTHPRKVHGIYKGREGQDLEACLLQTVFKAKNLIRYFRVVRDRAVEGVSEDIEQPAIDAFVDAQVGVLGHIDNAEKAAAGRIRTLDEHKSSVIPWVRSCGFDRLLRGFDVKGIRQCWRPAEDGEKEGELVGRVVSMTEHILEETWRWCVDGPESRLTRPMAVTLSQFWTEATIHSKGFRHAIAADSKARYFKLWTDTILCYWRVTTGQVLTKRRSDVAQTGAAQADPTSSSDNSNDTPPREQDEVLFSGTQAQQEAFRQCLNAAAEDDEEALQQSVVKFNLSLLQQELPRYRFHSPVLSYCAMLAANQSTQGWRRPGNYNGSLSGMIYCAQLWIFRHTCEIVDNNCSHTSDEVLGALCRQWMRQERSTTFGIILNWRLMLFDVAKKEVSSKNASWSLDGSEVCYQGTAIRMEQIMQLYERTLARAREILDCDLLLGADHLPRMSACALYEGEHHDGRGWWFGMDTRNTAALRGRETRLVQHIKATPALSKMFLLEDNQWRPSATRLYQHRVQEVLECLFVLIQVLVPPLRGPELMSVTVWNTEKLRSVLLKYQKVMLYTTYHKGQAQWGSYKDNIRFLTSDVGDIILNLLVYVYPLLKIFTWRDGRLLSPFLFSKDGQVWDEKTLTRRMRRVCAAVEVPTLSESHWRQICASVVKIHFGAERRYFQALIDGGDGDDTDANEDDGEEEDVAALARMSNHTVRTHNLAYANETSLIAANVWDGLIKQAHRASLLWAGLFHFGGGETAQLGQERVRPNSESQRHSGILKKIAVSVPRTKRHWTGHALLTEARRLYGKPHLHGGVPSKSAPCVRLWVTTWRCWVMATGTGKSLLFQLPSCLPGSGTTVLVVPLVVLRLDLVRRCRELNMDCQEWRTNQQTRATLVLMSVEAAGSDDGRAYLYQLHHTDQLDRIVVDECHLLLTASAYRPAMAQLALLRSIPVPFVYLTATLPPAVGHQLLERHCLTDVVEIRAATRRHNIRYRVQRLSSRNDDLLEGTASMVEKLWMGRYPGQQYGQHRAILFTRTIAGADQLATQLGCDSYIPRPARRTTRLRYFSDG